MEKTTLCAAIDNKGLVAYQLFQHSMHGPDFLCFLSNLFNSLRLNLKVNDDDMEGLVNGE